MLKILHLSDLHIGETCDYTGLILQKIIYSLRMNKEENIDVIIVTGDIFNSSSDDDNFNTRLTFEDKLEKALAFFNGLFDDIKNLSNNNLKREDILFVPGNHDLSRKDQFDTWKLYTSFLAKFYGDNTFSKLYDSNLMITKEDNHKKFLFLGLNSNYYDKIGNEYKECIDYKQIQSVDNLLNGENNKYLDYYKIAFFHHPFYIFPENVIDEKKGTLANLTEFTKKLTDWEIKLVLHGHKHLGGTSLIGENGAQIQAIAAGALGYYGAQSHSFNIITITDQSKIELKKYISKNNHIFEPDPVIHITNRYKTGMLRDVYHSLMDSERNITRTCILKMLNELYLQKEALNILKQNSNKDFLLFCIECRINRNINKNATIFENITKFSLEIEDQKNIKKLFESPITEIYKLMKKNEKDQKLEKEGNNNRKIQYSLALLAIFFTDLYLEFTELKSNNDTIKIAFNGSGIEYNLEQQYLFIKLYCYNSDSQKYAIESISHFQSLLFKLDTYFHCLKLNVKDILPKFENSNKETQYYKIDAFIPNLIPLLSGKNIYSSNLAFVRELIQNSIDAIDFRKLLEENENEIPSNIIVNITENKGKIETFQIRDYGIGMSSDTIEHYFTVLGKSYYKEYEFSENEFDKKEVFNPISNFGIGFLSVIRPCNKVVIKTKHFIENKLYELEIGQDQDYFFITTSKDSDNSFNSGTEITCYLKDEKDSELNYSSFENYIKERMLDIKYNIIMKCKKDNGCSQDIIHAKQIRENQELPYIYLPFNEDFTNGENAIMKLESDEITKNLLSNHNYGILIRSINPDDTNIKRKIKILNAGILVEHAELQDIFSRHEDNDKVPFQELLNYNEIIFNFPPNWLPLNVSRDEVENIKGDLDSLKKEIYSSYKIQLVQYLTTHNKTPLSVLVESEKYMNYFFNVKNQESKNIVLDITFEDTIIKYNLREENFNNCKYKNISNDLNITISSNRNIYNRLRHRFQDKITQSDFSQKIVRCLNETLPGEIKDCLNSLGLSDLEYEDMKYFPVILGACLAENYPETVHENNIYHSEKNIAQLIKKKILETCTINDITRVPLVSVKYETSDITKIQVSSEDLQIRIRLIAENYDSDSQIGKYDFILEKIILVAHKNCKIETICPCKDSIQEEYEYLRDTLKDLYITNSDRTHDDYKRIDKYQISSCYMGALYNLLIKSKTSLNANNTPSLCEWIWDTALMLLYMWILSDYKQDSLTGNTENKKKYEKLLSYEEKKLRWPEEKKEQYKKMLELKLLYSERFDILCFAELLYWITAYNECILTKEKDINDLQK